MVGAVLTVVALGIIGEVLAVLIRFAADDPKPSWVNVARLGGFFFYAFHHAGIRFHGDLFGAGVSTDVTFAVAALTGTLVALWLLARTGRAIAEEAGGGWLARGLHGAKVAVPYGLVCFGLAFALRISAGELGSDSPSIHPSYVAALLWPLGLAALAGLVGGVRTAGGIPWETRAWGRWVRGAVAGGGWMLGTGLVLGFVGLVLLAPIHPHATAQYFKPFDEGAADGLGVVYGTLLLVPNLAAWVLFPSMGGCLEASGNFFGFGGSFCFLSYTQFPSASAFGSTSNGPPNLPGPPAGYFLFLLVPLVAVLVGGIVAARRSQARSRQEALGAGALAGAAFSLFALLTAILASATAKVGSIPDFPGRLHFRFGPALVTSFLFSLAWGIVGGAVGGLWEGRSLPMRVATPAATTPGPVAEWPQPPPEAPAG